MVEAHRVAADLPATNPLALLIGGRNPAHRRRAAALGAGILVAITAAIAAVAMAAAGPGARVGEDPSGVPVHRGALARRTANLHCGQHPQRATAL